MCLLFVLVCWQVEKREKERMKRMVLDMHERQEEEDYQGTYDKRPLAKEPLN